MPTAEQRARRAARACSRGAASAKNVAIIQREIEEHANEARETALDHLQGVHAALEAAEGKIKRGTPSR